MAVSIAFHSVVVRNATTASGFAGGMAAHGAGFMAFDDVEAFVLFLERSGVPRAQIAVMRQGRWLIEPRDWLETGEFDGHSIAWLPGTQPETLFVPESDMRASQTEPLRREELEATYESLSVIDGVEAFRHRTTGEKVFIGRTTPTPLPRRRSR